MPSVSTQPITGIFLGIKDDRTPRKADNLTAIYELIV
jgi:hypothetical protein